MMVLPLQGRLTQTLAILAAALALASCHSPQSPAPAPQPPTQSKMQPQFTFASWSSAQRFIRDGKVIQTVSGKGGFSLILRDHTWVRLVAKPGDPLPKNPKEFVFRYAPNAAEIRHTNE